MIHPEELLKYKILLSQLPGIGPVYARLLVSYCGGVEYVFKMKKARLEKIPGIGSERAALIHRHSLHERVEEEVSFVLKHHILPLFYLDDAYPKRLRNCEDSPVLLYGKGNLHLNATRMVAIVGTRYITGYGRELTEMLVEGLQAYRVSVVSGMAYGVDVLAHKQAVKFNMPTIGVLAHGLDRLYPSAHQSVAEKMLESGGLLTEYMSRTIPDRENFPTRNRIVAGMCDATIVIESALRGGALITAELANGYNRDVFALPGKATDTYSKGCNELIRLNKATLVTSAGDIAQAMNWDLEDLQKQQKKTDKQLVMFTELDPHERALAEILRDAGPSQIDDLALRIQMPVSKVSTALLRMEFSGIIRSLPGKMYALA